MVSTDTNTGAAKTRVRPGDRLVRPKVLRERLGNISPMTEWRKRQTDPDFPKPVEGLYIDREIDEYLAILVARSDAKAA